MSYKIIHLQRLIETSMFSKGAWAQEEIEYRERIREQIETIRRAQ